MARATEKRGARSRRSNRSYPQRRSAGRVATGPAKRQRSGQLRRRQFEAAMARLDPQLAVGSFAQRVRGVQWGQLATGWNPSKFVSLLLLLGVSAMLVLIHTQDQYFLYREDVSFENLTYLEAQELYDVSEIEGWSAFWLQPETVRTALQRHPYVADAQVVVTFPGKAQVAVQEVQPTALWVTDEGILWLLADGTALPMRHDNSEGLLQILDGSQAAKDVGQSAVMDHAAIQAEVVTSALRLAAHFPGLGALRYNESIGLNFAIPNAGTWVYWGDGNHSEQKLQNLTAIQQVLQQQGRTTPIIDLRYPERPYFQ